MVAGRQIGVVNPMVCPLLKQMVLRLAREQHADSKANVKKQYAKADYFDKPIAVDKTYHMNVVAEHELAKEWFAETNLSVWYDIDGNERPV